ncbi:alpha/beta fold hydrolase [Polaromonas sp. LjRoot131]|uniref:alpha/beta fold hydrolase n=1 Tax=Polaromonas sp. LjRoot131 TaxID=3342262 RepID=UPI003ED02E95
MRTDTMAHEGLTLGLIAAGDPARPAIVLLHGWPHSKDLYAPVVDTLATGHFVLAFDLPDIGDSRGAPPSAEKTVLADIVIGAAERAGARSPVIAGLDVGGMVAYAAARDHGERIAGAVVMNTVIPGIDPWDKILADPRIWHFAFHALPELPELLVTGHQRAYFDFFTDFLAGKKEAVTEAHRAAFAQAYERAEALKAGFDWYRALQADAKHNSRHKNIETPMLYLRGDADGRSPDDYLPALKAAGAKRLTGEVLGGSGEFAPLEVPKAFTRALAAFAKECQAG